MGSPRIAMIGAGSGFVINIARELAASKVLSDCEFVLHDIDPERLAKAHAEVTHILASAKPGLVVRSTDRLESALEGCDYVITSCEMNRNPNWVKDVDIPRRHGVHQLTGENGGPGGIIHAIRNIGLFLPILKTMEQVCPEAWLMNFTNPMSFLCTYFKRYAKNPALGFCHQVHGSFGVVAEMLGMEPGDLQVISGGINHFNWLFDIRRRGSRRSYMAEFVERVKDSPHWREHKPNIPCQIFTREILETWGDYCVGYDDHIVEYIPFFYQPDEWAAHGFESIVERRLLPAIAAGSASRTLEGNLLMPEMMQKKYPYPKDYTHPYYAEKPCEVIEALETHEPHYLDAINIVNHGSISNLPADAIVDIPAMIVGGQARGIHVGELPIGPMELCRRQITQHEMIARAVHEEDASLVVQALCLAPYVHSITQAKAIWADFKQEFASVLPPLR